MHIAYISNHNICPTELKLTYLLPISSILSTSLHFAQTICAVDML
jgi:hypothetical protein